MVERFREKLTTEKLSDRVARMVRELEKAAQVTEGAKQRGSKREAK
jgi:UDP-N-acetylglucosamine:LPS N-acetylglucosamine transferase